MIDKIIIDPNEPSIYDLSDFGIEAHILVSGNRIELWDSHGIWTIGNLDESDRVLTLFYRDPPETKKLILSDDAYFAIEQILSNISDDIKTNIVNEDYGDEDQEPIASWEI